MAEKKVACTLTAGAFYKDHDVVLNTLDRENKGIYLSMDAFQDTVAQWDGVPVVFAPDHPDMELFEQDPALALGKVHGQIVGRVKEPQIDMTGHATLNAVLAIDDPTLERQIANGGLSLSTGFWHDGLDEEEGLPVPKVKGPVKPQHVLVFPENAYSNDVPGDKGSGFLNKDDKESDNISDDEEGLFARFKAWLKENPEPEPEPEPETMQDPDEEDMPEGDVEPPSEPKDVVEAAEQASDAVTDAIGAASFDPEEGKSLAEALKTIEKLKAKISELEGAAAETEAEMKWQSFKEHVPEGMLHGDGEQELREQFENDPHAAWLQLSEHKVDPDLPGEEGETFTSGNAGDEDGAGFTPKSRWDPATQSWEEAFKY